MKSHTCLEQFDVTAFQQAQVMVVGDSMLDTWILGDAHRISPEAPVPVVQLRETRHMLGGATNVARNLAHLGSQVHVFGVIGCDAAGDQLQQLCDSEPRVHAHFVRSSHRVTTQKTRICAHNHQIVRLDQEVTQELSESEHADLIKMIQDADVSPTAIIVSDYLKGTCTHVICDQVRQMSSHKQVPWLVDPKHTNWCRYAGATLITPNLKEYQSASQHIQVREHEGRAWANKYQIENLLVTQAERGMTLISPDTYAHISSSLREVSDVSGAGDTVIAVMALGMSAGLSATQSMRLANLAAGISVSKPGTATVMPAELQHVISP